MQVSFLQNRRKIYSFQIKRNTFFFNNSDIKEDHIKIIKNYIWDTYLQPHCITIYYLKGTLTSYFSRKLQTKYKNFKDLNITFIITKQILGFYPSEQALTQIKWKNTIWFRNVLMLSIFAMDLNALILDALLSSLFLIQVWSFPLKANHDCFVSK